MAAMIVFDAIEEERCVDTFVHLHFEQRFCSAVIVLHKFDATVLLGSPGIRVRVAVGIGFFCDGRWGFRFGDL